MSGECILAARPVPLPARLHKHRRPPMRSRARSSSSALEGLEGASYMNNPAIAQRETLRQFYLATSVAEQQAVASSALQLGVLEDTHTALHLLCHLAELALKGTLPSMQHSEADSLLLSIYRPSLSAKLPVLAPMQLGALLWSLAALGHRAAWTDELLLQVARLEVEKGRVSAYNTKELTSLLYAYGRLVQRHEPVLQAYATLLVEELVRRIDLQPYVRSAFSATDLADLVQSAAQLYALQGAAPAAQAEAGGAAASAAGVPKEVHTLLQLVGAEVRRQLANKNSMVSPFTPGELVRFLGSYAALGHRRSPAMLDSVASWVVQRIRSRHLNAASRPSHLAGLLEAYADLGHASVAVPELLSAVGEQICRLAAQQQERLVEPLPCPSSSGSTEAGHGAAPVTAGAAPAPSTAAIPASTAPAAGRPDEGLHLPELNSILASHLRLGYSPPPLLLQAVAPCVLRQLPASAPADVALHLHLLSLVPSYKPGHAAVGLMLARVTSSEDLGPEAQSQARQDAASLGWQQEHH